MKKMAIINDISGLGKCSMTAAIPVVAIQGVQACPLPTAVLSNQTGFAEYFCDDFTNKMVPYINQWKSLDVKFDSILTGYIASEKQIEIIKDFCAFFKKNDTLLVVDPVMADKGKIYPTHSKTLCEGIKSLSMKADIITPNLTEFCVISGGDFDEAMKLAYKEDIKNYIFEKSQPLFRQGLKNIIVTSVPCVEGKISNFLVDKNELRVASSQDFGGSYSGTGDLLSASVCAGVTKGEDVFDSLCRTVRFLEASIKATICEGTNPEEGICFEPFLKLL